MPALTYRAQEPELLFPRPEVSGRALNSWRGNPMTKAVLAAIYRERYRQSLQALKGNEEDFYLRKGKIEGIDWLLGELEALEAEILGQTEPPEDDE